MVDRLPQLQGTPGGRWPRRWISWERYRILHENRIEVLTLEGVVVREEMRFTDPRRVDGVLEAHLEGELVTASGGLLHVRKRLAVRTPYGRPQVLTAFYGYHGRVVSRGASIDVLRYDNSHGDTGTLHRHVYDDTGRGIRKEPLALDQLPPLGDIVAEVERRARLPRPRPRRA